MSYVADLITTKRRPVYPFRDGPKYNVVLRTRLQPALGQRNCLARLRASEADGLEVGLLTDSKGGGTGFVEADLPGYARQPLGPVEWRSLGLAINVQPIIFDCDLFNTPQAVRWLGLFDAQKLLMVGDLRQVVGGLTNEPAAWFESGNVVLLP